MKRLAIALLAVLIFATPAFAHHRQWETEKLVKWAGCQAPVFTSDANEAIESYYMPVDSFDGPRGLYVGTAPGTPWYAWLIILFHETGHCLQHQAGTIWAMADVERELDADRWSADLACGLGLDGRWMLHETFVWALLTFGYDGDPFHGTLLQRISQGDNATRCHVSPGQSPFHAASR